MTKCIVYTRADGRVSVLVPSPRCMKALCNGGIARPLRERHEIDKMVRNGRSPDLARRWVRALMSGGCTSAEAYGLIRDKDMGAGGTAPELWDSIGYDRWFRNAWVRSRNGGPIMLHVERCRDVQASTMYYAHDCFAKRAREENDLALLRGRNYYEEIPELDLRDWRRRLDSAGIPDEIRAVWPSWLPRPRSPLATRRLDGPL